MREFKNGDIVTVSQESITAFKYVPGFPEKLTDLTGKVTSTYARFKWNYPYITVRLDEAPSVQNLQFDVSDVALLIPVELDQRLTAIEDQLNLLVDNYPTERVD